FRRVRFRSSYCMRRAALSDGDGFMGLSRDVHTWTHTLSYTNTHTHTHTHSPTHTHTHTHTHTPVLCTQTLSHVIYKWVTDWAVIGLISRTLVTGRSSK